MQHFYTCFSGLFSNLRTSIAQVQRTRYSETYSLLRNVFARLRQSVLANSLRTVILLFVLALSCNVWGDDVVWDFTQNTEISLNNNQTYSFLAKDGKTEMRYTAGSRDALEATYLKENGKTSSGSAKDLDGKTSVGKNRLIRLFVSGKGKLTISCDKTTVGTYKLYDGSDGKKY